MSLIQDVVKMAKYTQFRWALHKLKGSGRKHTSVNKPGHCDGGIDKIVFPVNTEIARAVTVIKIVRMAMVFRSEELYTAGNKRIPKAYLPYPRGLVDFLATTV